MRNPPGAPARRTKLITIGMTLALAIGACSSAEPRSTVGPTPTLTSTPSPTPAPTLIPPPSTAGILLWLRADSGVQLTTRLVASGLPVVPASPRGSGEESPRPALTVSAWISSYGPLEAIQPDPRFGPALVPNAVGGWPAVWFDGVDDVLEVDLDVHPGSRPDLTVIVVFASDVATGDPKRKLYGSDDGGYDRAAGLDFRDPRGLNYTIFGGGSGVVGYFQLASSTPTVTVDSYHGASFSGWVDGAAKLVNTPVTHGSGPATFYVGGTGPFFSEPWQGPVAELLVYGRVLSDAERIAVEDFLMAKYGIKPGR